MKTLAQYLTLTRPEIINRAAYPLELATRSLLVVMFIFVLVNNLRHNSCERFYLKEAPNG